MVSTRQNGYTNMELNNRELMHRTHTRNIILIFVVYVCLKTCLLAGQTPLGTVIEVRDEYVVAEFDSSVTLQPGTMVAVLGGGTVKKHPLTEEVVVQALERVAKAQIIGKGGSYVEAKITWKKVGFELSDGMDVIPVRSEALPNSAPIQTGGITDISTPVQSSIPLRFPIEDPDGDEVFFVWELHGDDGRIGYLETQTTRVPKNTWHSPGIVAKATVTVTATDVHGHTLKRSMKLSTFPLKDGWRNRELKPLSRSGDKMSANSISLTRDNRGHWWNITTDSVFNISPGWMETRLFPTKTGRTISKPKAVALYSGLIHVLDAESPVVNVFEYDGTLKRSYGIHTEPSDIALSSEGVAFIADQGLGGVQVYEPDGKFRACLGKAGKGPEDFAGLTRVTLDHAGQLYALDGSTDVVHRFNQFQHRLPSWSLNLKGLTTAVDLSWHPQGDLLVLLADGRILRIEEQGKITQLPLKSAVELAHLERMEAPESIYVDISGDIFITYPKEGVIARHAADGELYGIRGAPFWTLTLLTVDCNGRIYGRYANSNAILILDSEGWITQQLKWKVKESPKLKDAAKLVVTSDGSALIALDSSRTYITSFDLKGSNKPRVFGQPGKYDGQFQAATDVVVDDVGRTYVLDSRAKRISIFDRSGYYLFSFGRKGKSHDELRRPTLLAVTPDGENAYVCDGYRIKRYAIDHREKAATHIGNTGGRGKRSGQFLKPVDIACDRQGLLYILDNGRRDLQVVDYHGNNAVVVHTLDLDSYGFGQITGMSLNIDGRPYLFDSGKLIGLAWKK